MGFPDGNGTRTVTEAQLILILGAATLLPLAAAALIDHELLGDDALITLTYAKNLTRGDGFVFNHEPATLGTTSPLFAGVVAVLGLVLPVGLTGLAVWIGAVCWAGLPWLFYAFRRDLGLENRAVAVLGAVVAASVWVSYLGMEAPLFAFLLVLAVCLFARGHAALAGLTSALLFLTRGEGALLFGILLAWCLLSGLRRRETGTARGSLLGLAVGFALPLAAWMAYAWSRFGAIFPNTLTAKLAQGRSGLWRPFGESLVFEWAPQWGAALGPWPFVNLWYALVVLGAVAVARRHRLWLVFAAWGLVYAMAYTALGVAGYPWYGLPVHFVLTLLVGLGLDALLGRMERLRGAASPALAAVLVAAIAAAIALPGIRTLSSGRASSKDRAYLELARWFHDHAEPGQSVAYHEIGYLGYYSDNRVVDLMGLVDPEIALHVAALDFDAAFWDRRPDYFVHLAGSRFLAGIVGHPDFDRSYRPVARLPGYDGNELTVYRRQEGPLAGLATR